MVKNISLWVKQGQRYIPKEQIKILVNYQASPVVKKYAEEKIFSFLCSGVEVRLYSVLAFKCIVNRFM